MGGRGSPPWTLYRYLSEDFEVVPVPFDVQPMKPGDKEHPFYDLDLLLIVHPVKVNRPQSPQPGMPAMGATTVDELSKESQYAVDQFIVNGGKVIAFLDNHHPVRRLNIAGSRESKEPGLYDWVTDVLERTKAIVDQQER